MVVKAQNIITKFGEKIVHDGVSFEIKKNEIFGILGGSGSGKSVLLKQMLMLEHFDGGEYEILGYKLKNISEEDALALRKNGVWFFSLLHFLAFLMFMKISPFL